MSPYTLVEATTVTGADVVAEAAALGVEGEDPQAVRAREARPASTNTDGRRRGGFISDHQ
jgi:hypothetical protein